MDLKKFQEKVNKKGYITQLAEPKEWVSTGNLSLNYLITGDFYRGIPTGRQVTIAGPQGSGKSFICGNIVKNAQDQGFRAIYIDTETALDYQYLTNIGVSLDEDKFLPVNVTSVEDCVEVLGELFSHVDNEDEKLLVVIDSISMMGLKRELEGFDKGEMSEDMGRKARRYKDLLRNINSKTGNRNISVISVMHAYEDQNMYSGENYRVSGGQSTLFIPSVSLMFEPKKLKEGKEVRGFTLKAETIKTRFDQIPGRKIQVEVPWDRGLDPYAGLLPVLEEEGLVEKRHAWYYYVDSQGNQHKFQKNDLNKHIDEILSQYSSHQKQPSEDFSSEEDVIEDDENASLEDFQD